MKRVLAGVMALSVFGMSVYSKTDGLEYNGSENNIKISGRIESGLENKKIKIIVTNPGRVAEDLESDFENALYYANEVYTDAFGKYEIIVPIEKRMVTGEYSFYVQDDEGNKPEKLSFYYADENDKAVYIGYINNADKADMTDVLLGTESMSGAIDIFAVDEEFVSVMADETAALLYDYKEKTAVTTENVKAIIEALAVVAAFNSEKGDLLFDNGEFLKSEIFDFAELDKDGVTLHEIFEGKMSKDGQQKVIDGLYGNNFKTENELFDKFAELVFLNAIKYPINDGTGHIEDVLTKENSKRIGISVDAYLDIKNNSQKKNTELDLMKETFSSVKNLGERLPEIVLENKEEKKGSSGGSGGGSSSGGATGSLIVTTIENGTNVGAEKKGFSDMADFSWAEEAVSYLYENNIVSGTGNNMFSPQKSVTREQFTVMLINSLGVELIENNNEFSDVLSGTYYEKHVATGVDLGIVKGIGSGIFGTGKTITRQDICTLIYRAYFKDEVSAENPEFVDFADVSDYAYSAIISLREKGIVNGFPDGTFRPKEVCTRAQAAKILYGAIRYIGDDGSVR